MSQPIVLESILDTYKKLYIDHPEYSFTQVYVNRKLLLLSRNFNLPPSLIDALELLTNSVLLSISMPGKYEFQMQLDFAKQRRIPIVPIIMFPDDVKCVYWIISYDVSRSDLETKNFFITTCSFWNNKIQKRKAYSDRYKYNNLDRDDITWMTIYECLFAIYGKNLVEMFPPRSF